MSKMILLMQYYKVISGSDEYNVERQKEIDTCLLNNLQNPRLTEVHMLNEQIYDMSFVPSELQQKLQQVEIGQRLTYKAAINYYNTAIPNIICILANADIFTDESIGILEHVRFDQSVIALNRYEYNDDVNAPLLNGLEINRRCTSLFPDYGPSIWTQDAWVWKSPQFNIDDVDFCLGVTGCDNHFAHLLYTAGYKIYNPSLLVGVTHYDRLSIERTPDGIRKGTVSHKRDPPPSDKFKQKLFLENIDDIIDTYSDSANNVQQPQRNANIKTLRLRKSVRELPMTIPASARFKEPGYWTYEENDSMKYLECSFGKVVRLGIIDTMGKPCSRDDKKPGYISKFKLQYNSGGKWLDYPTILDGNHGAHGNLIKRNYLEPAIYCNSCRIYCIESRGVPALKVRMFGHTITSQKLNGYTLTEFNSDWQKPVITEYNVYKQLRKSGVLPYNYFAFPWATLIDEVWVKSSDLKTVIAEYTSIGSVSYCTVVQHMRFQRLFPTFQALNIQCVFTPHCTLADKQVAKTFGIELYGFSLYAAVKRVADEAIVPIQSRMYLTSFLGQYDSKCYLTDIRVRIFDLFNDYPDCLIKRRGQWHFQGMVYCGTPKTDADLESEYKMALAQSKFSLCPSGSGPNSIRIWESLSYGSVPVILADTLVMPMIRTMAWTDAVIFWKESDIGELYAYLKAMPIEEVEAKSRACLKLFATYFDDDVFCRVLNEELESIIQYV